MLSTIKPNSENKISKFFRGASLFALGALAQASYTQHQANALPDDILAPKEVETCVNKVRSELISRGLREDGDAYAITGGTLMIRCINQARDGIKNDLCAPLWDAANTDLRYDTRPQPWVCSPEVEGMYKDGVGSQYSVVGPEDQNKIDERIAAAQAISSNGCVSEENCNDLNQAISEGAYKIAEDVTGTEYCIEEEIANLDKFRWVCGGDEEPLLPAN